MNELRCPKCLSPMRSIERNGVVIERCTECGGVFLDRGELERLAQAETAYYDRYEAERRDWREPHRDDDDDDRHRHGYHRGKKKRREFLEDLFGF